jgi:glycosyltransferase involved in cell wall biosynthesis
MRLVSIVEATTISGPVKPLLMFSRLARAGVAGFEPITHSLLTTQRAGHKGKPLANAMLIAAQAQGLGVDVVPERFRFDPRVLARMAHFIRARAPDIVETHDFKSHFLLNTLRSVGAVGALHWVAFHHGYTRMSARVRAYQQLDRVSLRHAEQVITLCRPFVEQLVARGVRRDRIEVISNAVAPRAPPTGATLSELRRSLDLAPGERIIVSVGRLSREKGHADLIEALRLLLAEGRYRDCRLLLVGDGGERDTLRSRASGLGDRIIFAGHQPDPWPYFWLADLFVLPSHTEGSPLVLFEAMAAALPIVATAVGGIPEVAEDGRTAILVPPMQVRRLADAIAGVLAHPQQSRAMGAAAQRALSAFSPESYAQRLLKLYAGLTRPADT